MRRLDIERVLKLLHELKGYTLIVEGRKDVTALKALGLIDVIPLNGQPVADFVDRLDGEIHTVILTDFDEEGKRLCAKLLKLLQRRRIKANPRLRHMLMAETGITRIEELDTAIGVVLTKEKGDTHGEIGANFYEVHSKGKHKGKGHR